MKPLQNYRFLALALFAFILIVGCNQSDAPTAPGEMQNESGEFSLQKRGNSGTIIPGIVHWWPGDGNAKDVIGGNDGVPMGGVGFAEGKVGEAFSFDGIDDFVDVPAQVGGYTEATVEAWVKTDDPTTAYYQAIMIGDNVQPDFVHLQLDGGNVAYVDSGYPWWIALPFISSEPTGVFRHIAMSIKSGETILYVDGNEVGRSNKTFPSVTKGEIKIGGGECLMWGAWYGRWLHGLIDDVRIYDHALSAGEIQSIVNSGCKGMKVAILHKPGKRAEKTLMVPYQALKAHLGHGDEILGLYSSY